jgi:hypothetical protein
LLIETGLNEDAPLMLCAGEMYVAEELKRAKQASRLERTPESEDHRFPPE